MLQVPLEIAFHNIASSQRAEQEIRARVADLERLYPRLVSCRVRIDQRAKDLTGTIPPVVHIELGIPGRSDLVVSHEPEHLLRKYRHPDLHKAITEAFRKGVLDDVRSPIRYRWAFCEQMLFILLLASLAVAQPRIVLVYLLPWYLLTYFITRYVDFSASMLKRQENES